MIIWDGKNVYDLTIYDNTQGNEDITLHIMGLPLNYSGGLQADFKSICVFLNHLNDALSNFSKDYKYLYVFSNVTVLLEGDKRNG